MEFVAFNPGLVRSWFEKATTGRPVTAAEHNAVVVQVALQRDVIANQSRMVTSDAIVLPSASRRGTDVPLIGWSWQVEPVSSDSAAAAERRDATFSAARYVLEHLRPLNLVSAPAGSVTIPGNRMTGSAREVAVMGEAERAVVPERDIPAGQGILEDRALATQMRELFDPSTSNVRLEGIGSTAALVGAGAAAFALSRADHEETNRAIRRAAWVVGGLAVLGLYLRFRHK